MSTPPFDPQPCCEPDGPDVPQEVTIIGPLPLPVDVVSPDPLNVNVTNQLTEPLDVNIVSPLPVPVTGTVSVNEPVDVNVLGTVAVTPNPLPVSGTVTVTPNPLPVTGTVTTGGSTVASTTLTTATTGNGTTIDFTAARSNVSLFIMVNGVVTSGVIDMQASQDGVNWVKVASSAALTTGVNQHIGFDAGAFRWFRGVVSENVVGGGTVTATLMFA